MPAPSTCDEFLDVVRESGVVDEAVLNSFVEERNAVTIGPEEPAELAEGMLKAGLITPFQKDLLLQGKRRGYIIAEKYILLDHIGAGGMGSVYLCEHRVMRRRVAIKVLPTAFGQNPEYVQRFHREARAAAALDHPNIVRAHDVDQDGKMHFLVMEYVEGASLQSIVRSEGPLAIPRAADYIAQAAAGLQHAHEAGLVHRDIKPGNLLVDRKGTVKVLDMGLALFFQEQGQSLTQQYDANAVLGTAEYLAPEQAIDSHGVDIRADIYSLGLTFFFLLTGKSPYGEAGTVAQKLLWHQMRSAKSVREFRPEVPEGLDAVIIKMLAKDRAQRYQIPGEVVEALAPWVRGVPEVALEPVLLPDEPAVDGSAAETKKAAATLNAAPSPAEAPTEAEKKAAESTGVRAGKTTTRVEKAEATGKAEALSKSGALSKADALSKSGPMSKRTRLAKGEEGAAEAEPKSGITKKGPKSGKQKRGKNVPAGFWTKQRLIMAGSGGGVLLLLLVGIIIWAATRTPTPPSPGTTKATDPVAMGTSSTHADTSKDTKPTARDTKPTPKPSDRDTKPTPKPSGRDTKPTPKPNPITQKPDPQPKNPQPPKKMDLADYFPKAGSTLVYDVATYVVGAPKAAVQQVKWDVKDGGVIVVSHLQDGYLEGASLQKGGTPKWIKPGRGPVAKGFYRTDNGYHEFGELVGPNNIAWDRVLPLSAAKDDTWTLQYRGEDKKYTVERFEQHKGQPDLVIIRESVALPPDAEIVTRHTYAKGKGEVARTIHKDSKGTAPLLLSEWRLDENALK